MIYCYRLTKEKRLVRISLRMKLIMFLLGKEKKEQRRTIAQYQQDMLSRQGREQFKKLVDRGLGIPVASL